MLFNSTKHANTISWWQNILLTSKWDFKQSLRICLVNQWVPMFFGNAHILKMKPQAPLWKNTFEDKFFFVILRFSYFYQTAGLQFAVEKITFWLPNGLPNSHSIFFLKSCFGNTISKLENTISVCQCNRNLSEILF